MKTNQHGMKLLGSLNRPSFFAFREAGGGGGGGDKLGQRNGPADMNVNVIYTHEIGNDAFNGLRWIKTETYFRLGWVWLTATSIKRYGDDIMAGPTQTTFQSNRLDLISRPFRLSWMLCSRLGIRDCMYYVLE